MCLEKINSSSVAAFRDSEKLTLCVLFSGTLFQETNSLRCSIQQPKKRSLYKSRIKIFVQEYRDNKILQFSVQHYQR